MKKVFSLSAGLFLAASTSHAYVITPVWEYFVSTNSALMTPTAAAIPILTNTWNSLSKTNTRFDGQDLLPCLGGLKRYDANRMLLAVSENGIRENADLINTNLALYMLSTNYPDRSLIWINPSNGLPMGLALTVGLRPVQPSTWYSNYIVTTAGPPNTGANTLDGANASVGKWTNILVNTTFDFDVSDDGFVYTGYRNKLIRYRPDGSGGFLPTPELCTELGVTTRCVGAICDTNGIQTGGSDPQRWNHITGMFGMVHVRGSGTNTLVMAGGRGHNGQLLGVMIYDTLDATNFFGFSRQTAASFSMAIPCPTTPTYSGLPGELWTFNQTYPQSDNGQNTSTLGKWTAFPYGAGVPTTNVLPAASQVGYAQRTAPAGSPAASFIKIDNTKGTLPAIPGGILTNYYRGGMIGAEQALAGCPFFVAYANPSWNSKARNASDGNPYWFKPGWIGLHDLVTGTRLGVWEQQIKESDVLLGSDAAANWFGNYADIGLYTNNPATDQPEGAYEITWGSYCYGYGRYIVKNENIVLTSITNDAVSTSTVNYTLGNTSTNNDYVLQKTVTLDTPVWTDVTTGIPWPGPYNTAGIPLTDAAATETNAFYRLKLRVP
ncbi:MAG: hypothetical protein EXS24_00515 [Pedosphaera sp.]|nr:hypothetical protein [Pedosphaera sp.]